MTCLAFAASQSFRTDLLMIRRCVKFRQPCEPSGLPESNYQSTTDEVEKTTNGISSQQLMSQTSHMLLANDKWKWRTKDMVVQFCTSSSRWYLQFWTFWSWLTLSEMTWHISKHCCSRLWINLKPTFVSKWGLCGKSAEGIFFLEKIQFSPSNYYKSLIFNSQLRNWIRRSSNCWSVKILAYMWFQRRFSIVWELKTFKFKLKKL